MERIVQVHPSHLPVVAAMLLCTTPVTYDDRRLWHCSSQTELAKEYARAFAIVCPEVDDEQIVMNSLTIECSSSFQVNEISVRVAIQIARAHRPLCPPELHPLTGLIDTLWEGLFGHLRSLLRWFWKKPARTCARQNTWMLPIELRDVWPRIFAETAATTASARRWQAKKDSKMRAARVRGIVDAMCDKHDICVGCLAHVLRDREDLRSLMAVVVVPPRLWQAVARRMRLEGPLPWP